MPFRKGNKISNVYRFVRPCTMITGMKNKIVRAVHARTTTTFPIHLVKKDVEKKAQYMSRSSGAGSVSHSVGFCPCCMFKVIAAPIRDLNDTNAARSSYQIENYQPTKKVILTLSIKSN